MVVCRRFNSPTGISPEQQVWIQMQLTAGFQLVRVECNERDWPIHISPLCWPIELLLPYNQLRVELIATEPALEFVGVVKRLIDVSPWFVAQLQIT